MRVRGKILGLRTLSRFALIGMIGGGTAACSSDASRLGDPFTNPFASLTGEPSATGSLPNDGVEGEMAPAPAIRTPRIQSQALPAPGPALSPRPGAVSAAPAAPRTVTRVATAEPISGGMASNVAGLNPDAGRAMTPRASAPAPQPKLQFGKTVDKAAEKAAEKRAAEAAAAKAAEARRDAERQVAAAKVAEAKAAEAKAAEKAAQSKKLADAKAAETKKAAEAAKHPRPGQKGAEKVAKAEPKVDPKDAAKEAAKAEAARKAEADAKQAKADAAKKLAEARAAETAAKAAAKESKEAAKASAKEAAPAAPVKVASADASAPIPAAAPQAAAESFRWPAKGRIINAYGSSGNEGINIAVPEGTPVKAAEDGTVAYAGSDVKGYGKLVLVRHNNGYVSAYAHNGELDVRPGEKVKRGQTIAKSGATGNVTSPQLHFELRKGATPVDPMPHLGG
ncbi:murein hydrolase activator EnvC family protein [Methylorubrum extorquens]|uniref:murein hydrolase activator EnvC family protein n=1 Tax=Methylorubrum extorquens TaxID=408 RepID=UPI001EE564FD|nr:M23 family metallopeptidase [Methylorubrum extorquens]MCG5246473.1 peptidoglycan DD-metalloendopeptidase family protein [Methylorubrum extorquens]